MSDTEQADPGAPTETESGVDAPGAQAPADPAVATADTDQPEPVPTDREAAVQRLGVATDAALTEMGYERMGEPVPDAAIPPPPPLLGVIIHDMGDGTAGIHAIEPDGTEHAITMPTAHGALIAFMDMIRGRLPELGNRATAWTVKKPGDEEEPAEPPVAA